MIPQNNIPSSRGSDTAEEPAIPSGVLPPSSPRVGQFSVTISGGEALSPPIKLLSCPSSPWTRYKRVWACVCACACTVVGSKGGTVRTPPETSGYIGSSASLLAESLSHPGGGRGEDTLTANCPTRPAPNRGSVSGWSAW